MQSAADEEKVKPQQWTQTLRWAGGIALLLLGTAAWSYSKYGLTLNPRALPAKGAQGLGAVLPGAIPVPVQLGDLSELTSEPESLEDALSNLESGANWASQGIELPDTTVELPAVDDKPKSKAKAKKTKTAKVSPPKPKKASKSKKAAKAPEVEEAAVKDFVDKLTVPPKESKAAAEDSDINDVLEKLEAAPARKTKSKKKKKASQDEEEEKAKAIIKEALEQMSGAAAPEDGSEAGASLRERLQAMVADEEERDKDPEVRKAKAIIKDSIDKMSLPKPRKNKASKVTEPEEEEGGAEEESHFEFAKRLKEEAAQKPEHDLASIRDEFKREYGGDSKRLLCSGCKLVAARLGSELSAHDVHEAENPALMLASKRRAIDSTCRTFRHLHVTAGEGGPRFEASEMAEEDGGDAAPRLGQKLCSALLEDAKFEVLSHLIRQKVPASSLFHAPEPVTNNWERLLCAQRARFCKRSEVREDEEAEEL